MKRIKVIKLAINYLESLERTLSGKAEPVAEPAAEPVEATAKPAKPEWNESEELIWLKERLDFLMQEFERISSITNPALPEKKVEDEKNIIRERLSVVEDMFSDIPVMEKCPIALHCDKCKDVSNYYSIAKHLLKIVEFHLQILEFGSCQFISQFKDSPRAS
jgi:hypothetical protein